MAANVIIKSDDRRAYEDNVRKQFTSSTSAEAREAAECVAARSSEALDRLRRMGGK